MRRLLVVCSLAMLWLSLTPPSVARAQGEAGAQCTVTEVKASNEKSGVDARLERFKSKLGKPPFTGYDSFKLLGEQTVSLERQKPKAAKLVNGNLTLMLKDKTVVQGGKARLRIDVDMENDKGVRIASPTYSADSGDSIMVGGPNYENGTYLLILTCAAP